MAVCLCLESGREVESTARLSACLHSDPSSATSNLCDLANLRNLSLPIREVGIVRIPTSLCYAYKVPRAMLAHSRRSINALLLYFKVLNQSQENLSSNPDQFGWHIGSYYSDLSFFIDMSLISFKATDASALQNVITGPHLCIFTLK